MNTPVPWKHTKLACINVSPESDKNNSHNPNKTKHNKTMYTFYGIYYTQLTQHQCIILKSYANISDKIADPFDVYT